MSKIPIFDFECVDPACGAIFEWTVSIKDRKKVKCPYCWNSLAKQIWTMGKSPSFKLTYNAQTDMVDWDQNRSQYWDQYKKDKSEGKKVRIPKHDGG